MKKKVVRDSVRGKCGEAAWKALMFLESSFYKNEE